MPDLIALHQTLKILNGRKLEKCVYISLKNGIVHLLTSPLAYRLPQVASALIITSLMKFYVDSAVIQLLHRACTL